MAVPAHDERDFEFAKKYNLGVSISIYADPPIDEYENIVDSFDSPKVILKSTADDYLKNFLNLPRHWQEDGTLVNS
jgi:leucyl-tRNA synthetase